MTLSPSHDRKVVGLDGPLYHLPEQCAICGKTPVERHHAWRRSDVIGDKWWVLVPSERVVVGNCIPLCKLCHGHLTDNYAKLEFRNYRFYWGTLMSAAHECAWNPPVYEADEGLMLEVSLGMRAFDPLAESKIDQDQPSGYVNELHGTRDHDPNFCPACKRRIPKQADKLEDKRVRKTFSVAVPVDQQENGADVLDTLIEEARKEMFDAGLPYGESDAAKYYVVSTALALFVTHAHTILGDT